MSEEEGDAPIPSKNLPFYLDKVQTPSTDVSGVKSLPGAFCCAEGYGSLQTLFEKYENNPYMFQRLCFHLTNILPTTLESEDKNHEKRIQRNKFLTSEQQQFIQVFLSKNQYYYLPNNSCFYQYNGKHYSAIKEDDIQHQLLTTISKDRTLMEWKQKTKINILKQIKERNLLKSIPETSTIQHVMHLLYPAIFSNRNQAKYFLTVLGDNILKKTNDDLVFLIKPKTKKILAELDNISYITTGYANITHNFVTKYHENYDYANCRLININSNVSIDNWHNVLSKTGLDILCVAAYYSTRFGNSEQYLINNTDESLSKYTLYLKEHSQTEMFQKFCEHSLQKVDESASASASASCKFSINWKNTHYIWKLFISHYSFPSMIYLNTLKNLLKEKYSYDETTDTFNNITSKYLPTVSDFILFWEKTITQTIVGEFGFWSDPKPSAQQKAMVLSVAKSDGTPETTVEGVEMELEIDEICGLFKKWTQDNYNTCSSNGNITEHDILKIVNHYFPNIVIHENKYILNVICSLWDKISDIDTSLESLKIYYKHISSSEDTTPLISFDEMYEYYLKNKQTKFTVSKRYFEKYVCANMEQFIEFDTFISSSWYC